MSVVYDVLNTADLLSGKDIFVCPGECDEYFVVRKLDERDMESQTVRIETYTFRGSLDDLYHKHLYPQGVVSKDISHFVAQVESLKSPLAKITAAAHGIRFMIANIPAYQLFFDKSIIEEPNIVRPEWHDELFKDMKNARSMKNSDGQFPAIFLISGSQTYVCTMDSNNRTNVIARLYITEKTLLGIAKTLLHVSDLDELIDLASKGDRRNTDTVAGELIRDDPKSAYGQFPADLPCFPFGKASTIETSANFSREDMAASLIAMIVPNYIGVLFSVSGVEMMNNVYLIGRLFSYEYVRREIEFIVSVFFRGVISINTLRSHDTAAIGAMIAGRMKKHEDVSVLQNI